MGKTSSFKAALLVLLLPVLAACATKKFETINNLPRTEGQPKILLLPMDIQLSELTAGGTQEPNALWTKQAEDYVVANARTFLENHNVNFEDATASLRLVDMTEQEQQIIKLHSVVGESITRHQNDVSIFSLPNKKGTFEWTLGDDVTVFADKYDADYGLFVFVRDSYASAGRAAVMIVGALLGVGVQGGFQYGYASLVDLRNGDVVWFNTLSRGSGDLRKEKPAKDTVDLLLNEFPT